MRTCTYPISRFLSMIAHFGFVRIGVSHRCPISFYSKCASLNDLYLYVDFSPNPGNPQLDQDCLNPPRPWRKAPSHANPANLVLLLPGLLPGLMPGLLLLPGLLPYRRPSLLTSSSLPLPLLPIWLAIA